MKSSNNKYFIGFFTLVTLGLIFILLSQHKQTKDYQKSLSEKLINNEEVQVMAQEETRIKNKQSQNTEVTHQPKYFPNLEKKLLRFQPEGSKVKLRLLKKVTKKQGKKIFHLSKIYVEHISPSGNKNSYVAVYNEEKNKVIATHSRKFNEHKRPLQGLSFGPKNY